MPSFCVIADTHKLHRSIQIPECDILIHCGDICSFESGDHQTLTDIDNWFSKVPAKEVICIGGNHDYLLENRAFSFKNATYLQDQMINIDGINIYGSPWCPDLQGFAFYANDEKLHAAWKKIPREVDILITHTPPAGILDLPSSKFSHLGCPMLRAELDNVSPLYHLFGHVHASSGFHQQDGIVFVNAAIVGGPNYEIRNKPHLFTIN